MAHDVFISYSTDDANEANAIVNALESNGARCWIASRDINSGDIWAQAIMSAISGSRIAVVVFSASANSSKDVLNEVDAAIRKGLIVIPFRIEKVAPDGAMEYHLRTRHWLDAMTPDLESGIKRLVGDVKAILAGEPRPTEPFVPFKKDPKPTPPSSDTSDSKTTIRIPKLTVFLARFWGRHKKRVVIAGGIAAAGLIGWLALNRNTVSGVTFGVPVAGSGGNEVSFPVTARRMRFFEGGYGQTAQTQRIYVTKLPSEATRYVNVELSLEHDRPERPVPLPISCTFYKPDGGVYAVATQNLRIQTGRDNSSYVLGWGSNVPGTWPPAKYRADCSYGGTLIGRDRFEITGDAVAKGPPDISSLGARVMAMKYFESAAGALPPQNQRIYAERFDAGTARYINVEILTNHAATGQAVDLPLSCTFNRPDGSVLFVTQNSFKVPATYENTSFATGTGWKDPGRWRPGVYRVTCVHDGKTISQGSFEVLGR